MPHVRRIERAAEDAQPAGRYGADGAPNPGHGPNGVVGVDGAVDCGVGCAGSTER